MATSFLECGGPPRGFRSPLGQPELDAALPRFSDAC
jgi:hypothetical protein